MKKVFGLAVIFAFFVLISGCAQKDRLTTPLMTVSIDPVEKIEITVGSGKTLSAFVRDASGNLIVQPVFWSVSPSIGEFSSTTSMNTTFTASAAGDAVITLTCSGISATVEVSVS